MNHSMPGLPGPSPTPGVYPNSCPLSRLHNPTISSSVVPFSSCLQSFSTSGSFQMSQLCIRWPKYWSFSFNISPSSEYPGLISLQSKGLSRVFFSDLQMLWVSALCGLGWGPLKKISSNNSAMQPKWSITGQSLSFTTWWKKPDRFWFRFHLVPFQLSPSA